MKTLAFFLFIFALALLTGCASQPTTNNMTGFEIDTEVGPLDGPRACRVARKNNPNEVC